jgi:site-specific recombinase XerD
MNATTTFEQYLYRLRHTSQTIRTYLYSYSVFLVDNPNPEDYCYKDILEYIKLKSGSDYSPSARVYLLNGIKKYYDYLIAIGRRNDHPCKNFTLRIHKKKGVIHQDLFSSSELELLMERKERYPELMLKNKVLISLLIYQGLASGEIERLNINHIDLDNGSIFIKASTQISQRHLELNKKQYRLFDQYITEGRKALLRTEKEDAFILGKLGNRISVEDISYLVSTYKGLFPDRDLNPGTIRQSVIANWLNEKKLPLEQVQLMSGQRWLSTTVKYRQISLEKDREIMNRFFPLS